MTGYSIPREEYALRVKKTQAMMQESNLDVIITFSTSAEPSYSSYYSNFIPAFETAGIAIPKIGNAALLVGPESRERAEKTAGLDLVKRMIAFREPATPNYTDDSFDTFDALFQNYAKHFPIQRVGIGGWSMIPHEIFQEIRQCLTRVAPEARLVPAEDILVRVSQIKSDAEISCIRESARITRLAMDEAIRSVRVGITCSQIKGVALAKMYAEGAEGESFCSWVTCGEDTIYPISSCSDRPLVPGDLVQIEIGARYHGYSSVIGRAVILGEADEHTQELIQTVIEAKQTVQRGLQECHSSKEVAMRHREYLINCGKESWMAYGPCHGTGTVECEYPWIECETDFALQENMVFCMDIFLADHERKRGVRYEDMVRVTANGIEGLTSYPDVIFINPV